MNLFNLFGKNKSKKREQKCILTFARSWNTLAAARCLGRHGVKVITGDVSHVAAAGFSRYSCEHFKYPDPSSDPEGFIDKLVKVAKKHKKENTDLVLIPMHTSAEVIAEHKDRFEGLVKMVIPTKEQFNLAGDKALLSEFCEEHNLHMPRTLRVNSPEEFVEKAPSVQYPAFLKLLDAVASIGLHKVKSSEEAIKIFKEMVQRYKLTKGCYPILQEFVEGEDYCTAFLFNNGKFCTGMTYHNILDYPKKSGMGAVRETVRIPRMIEMGREILEKMKWNGVAEIDFRWDGKSEPWIIEINPRFWGGLAQSIETGWEYPYLVYKLAVDGHVDFVDPEKYETRTMNPCLTALLTLQEITESKADTDEMAAAFTVLREDMKKHHLTAVNHILEQLEYASTLKDRMKAVKKILHEERAAVNEIFRWKDPFPILGILYPLVVFLHHGKITPELLMQDKKEKK